MAGTAILGACQVSSIVSERSPADPYKEDPTAVARGGAIFKSVCSGYCHQLTPTTSDALFLFDPPNVPPPGHREYERMDIFEHRLADWARGRPDRFHDPVRVKCQSKLGH